MLILNSENSQKKNSLFIVTLTVFHIMFIFYFCFLKSIIKKVLKIHYFNSKKDAICKLIVEV